jgi:hypothetical protein
MRTSLRLALAFGLGVTTLGAAVAGPAQNNRDGLWSVQLVTETGSCDRSYTAAVAVENGSVRPLSGGASVSGQVAPNGAVNLDIRKSLAQAAATGRLNEKSGAGTWHLAMLGCQGRWTASKRTQTAAAD